MKNRVIAALVAVGALALSACSNTQQPNPCTAWVADNGPYIVKYTAKPGQDAACLSNQLTVGPLLNGDAVPFDGTYSDVSAQLYVKGNDIELDLLPLEVSLWSAQSDGTRASGTTLAAANFATGTVDGNNECTVTQTSAAADPADLNGGTSQYSFVFKNLRFLEDANAQGTAFTGDVDITSGGCTASYTVTGVGPEVECTSNDDCLPVPDLAAGRPFSSGIASELHTYCDTSAGAQAWTTGGWVGADPGTGVCFLADAYPSVCPNGQIEGAQGSSCNAGK